MIDRVAHVALALLSLVVLLAAIVYAAPAFGDAGPEPAAVAAPAEAQPAPAASDPGDDPVGWASSLYAAVRGGRWAMVAGLALVAVVYAFRRWVLRSWRWAQTGAGGVAVTAGLGVLGMLANAGLAGRWPDGKAWGAAVEAIATAIAAYVAARKVAHAPSSAAPARAAAT